jgi:hypothetical protein
MMKKGIKSTGLADNTGHIIGIWEFMENGCFLKGIGRRVPRGHEGLLESSRQYKHSIVQTKRSSIFITQYNQSFSNFEKIFDI